MARTDRKGSAVGLAVARESAELAAVGAGKGLFREEDLAWIFKTVAKACIDKRDQYLYLAKCNAHGLSPLKGELFAIERKSKDGGKSVTFVTSYHVFVSRARRAGFVLKGDIVCKGDDFIMDAVSGHPVKHAFKPEPGRGRNANEILGAWAGAFDASGRCVTGKFWPTHELLIDGGYNPLREKIPGHFAWKTAVCRIGRLVAPDLSSLYGAEEFGAVSAEPGAAVAAIEVAPGVVESAAVAELPAGASTASPSQQAAGEPEDADVVPERTVEPPADPPLSFPERAALLKEFGLRGIGREADVLAFCEKALGERPSDGTKGLTRSQRDKIVAALPPLKTPKEGA